MNNQDNLFPKISKANTFSKTMEHIESSDFSELELKEHMNQFNYTQQAEDEYNNEISYAIRKLPTADSINTMNVLQDQNYQPTNIILLKGVPHDSSEFDVINLVRRFGTIKDIYLVRHKQYAFVEFKKFSSAIECYQAFVTNKPQLKKSLLHVCFTGKTNIIKSNSLPIPPNRFLLIVFQKFSISINQNFISHILSPYGNCNKIYIYKKKILQALVEMEDIGQAILIKEHLDGANINDQAVISILYIDQNNFIAQEKEEVQDSNDFDNLSLNFQQLNVIPGNNNMMKNNGNYGANPKIKKDFNKRNIGQDKITDYQIHQAFLTNNPTLVDIRTNFEDELPNVQLDQNYPNQVKHFMGSKVPLANQLQTSPKKINPNEFNNTNTFFRGPIQNDNPVQNSFHPYYPRQENTIANDSNQKFSQFISDKPRAMNQSETKPQLDINYENHVENIEKNLSKVTRLMKFKKEKLDNNAVLVKNIPIGITPVLIFKLFGMYGNVQKVKIFHKAPNNALVEYEDQAQALLAKMHLNGCPIYGNDIIVTLCDPDYISFADNNNDLIVDFSESKDHRYKIMGSKNYKNIVAPSKVLHLSNLCEDKNEYFYMNLFKNYGKIVKMHEMKGESKMYLMEMKSIADAICILMNFHNFDIDGKFLKVSFSKYQNIKE